MSTITLRNGLVKSTVGNSIMIYDIKGEMFYAFNDTASMIIDLMEFNVPISQIKKTLSKYFTNSDIGTLELNVDDFIKTLEKLNFTEKTEIVNTDYVQCSITNSTEYSKPSFKEYTKEWLLENHPGTFYNLTFSDRWGPSTTSSGGNN